MVAKLEKHENVQSDSSEMSYRNDNETRSPDSSIESTSENSTSLCATTCNGSHMNKSIVMSDKKGSKSNDVLPNFVSTHALSSVDTNLALRNLTFDTNDLSTYPASLYALASTALRMSNDQNVYHPSELEVYASLLSKNSKIANMVNTLPISTTSSRNLGNSPEDITKNLHCHHNLNSVSERPLDFSFRQRKPTNSSDESSDSHSTLISPNESINRLSASDTPTTSVFTFSEINSIGSNVSNSCLHANPVLHPLGMNHVPSLKNGKATRPFKAYPRDPLSLPFGMYSLQFSSLCQEGMFNLFPGGDDFCRQYRKRIQQAQERLVQRLTGPHLQSDITADETVSQSSVDQNESSTNTRCTDPAVNSSYINPVSKIFYNSSKPEISPSGTTILPPPKKRHRNLHEDIAKDDAYWERRRKNNEAAKRSRDARRAKEDEIALRAALLEQENLKLRVEVAQLKQETNKLRCMLYNS